MEFGRNETENLLKLQQELKDGTYRFSGYYEFKVYEPKERVINAPYYKDKVVQLAINNILKEIYQPSFIYDSYSCLDSKGTHACVERIYYFMRKAYWEYGKDAYIVKIDMKKFFYSIDREVLKKLYAKKIKCKQAFELICKIIDSSDLIDKLGLPLGNTLSQISANVYLNEVDQYAKRYMGLKYYVRYADDIVIIVENKERAKEVLCKIKIHTESKLNLMLNMNKSKVFPINQGVNAIGFKIHPTHMLLRDKSKRRIKRKLSKFRNLLIDGKITIEKVEQILNSWHGHAKQGNSYNFIQGLLERFDYIKLINNVFKIKEEVIINARNERALHG